MATRGAHRKTVTVLFCDLAGSTALGEAVDPERLHVLLARYFERMQAIVTRHGGSVEKFSGDAQTLYALDQIDQADAWADRAAELGASDEVWTQMLWRQVKAKILAHRGQHDEAERVAREAVAICDTTELLDLQGSVYADLGEVLILAGKPAESAAALEQALACYERKGNLVSAQRTRERLAGLQPVPQG